MKSIEMISSPAAMIQTYECNPPEVMRPVFDAIWNACGYSR